MLRYLFFQTRGGGFPSETCFLKEKGVILS
jgi:hypothetical protein